MRKVDYLVSDCANCKHFEGIVKCHSPKAGGVVDSVCQETDLEFLYESHEIPCWCPLQEV